jgi:hypothetical protein
MGSFFREGLPSPGELVIVDKTTGQEVILRPEMINVGNDGRWVKVETSDLTELLRDARPKKTQPEITSEFEAMKHVIGSEPYLSMTALADWYLDNGTADEKAYTSPGLVKLFKHGKFPKMYTIGKTGWWWEPLAHKVALYDSCHTLPLPVYHTVNDMHGKDPLDMEMTRLRAILYAAKAWGMWDAGSWAMKVKYHESGSGMSNDEYLRKIIGLTPSQVTALRSGFDIVRRTREL